MATATINKASFLPGEKLSVSFEFADNELPSDDFDNVSTDIFRLAVARNRHLIGFGASPIRDKRCLSVSVKLPATASPGLYAVTRAVLTSSTGDMENQPIKFEPPRFEIRLAVVLPASRDELLTRERSLAQQRETFSRKPHVTDKASAIDSGRTVFRVIVFAVGTLIHGQQQLEGFKIVPLRGGFSHRHMLELANSYLATINTEKIPFLEATEEGFQRGTPTIAVDYEHVEAIGHEDALEFCRDHAKLIFMILGRERGQVPREFAGIAISATGEQRWHYFEMPGYRGNLVSDFSPNALAEKIECSLPKLQHDAFARLITYSYSEATAESDPGICLLRRWTILELAADRNIPANNAPINELDGSPILKPNNKPETTASKVGRVYEYLKMIGPHTVVANYSEEGATRTVIEAGDASHPSYKPGVQVFSLWEMVRAAYVIRNSVAHEGLFDPGKASNGGHFEKIAALAFTKMRPNVLRFIESVAQKVLWREA